VRVAEKAGAVESFVIAGCGRAVVWQLAGP